MLNDIQLLELMLKDMNKQEAIYNPGPYWKKYAKRTAHAIRKEGLNSFRSSVAISKGFADVAIDDPFGLVSPGIGKQIFSLFKYLPLFSTVVHRYDRLLKGSIREQIEYQGLYYNAVLGDWFQEFSTTHQLPNSQVGNPTGSFRFPAGMLASSYLRAYAWIAEFSKQVDFQNIYSGFEIGGGFGAMTHSLIHIFPNIKKYIYLDIPPNLYIGTQYLKHFYGEQVIDYRMTRDRKKISFTDNDELEILAICPWQIENLDAPVDYFWNSSSFQEMPEPVVINYAKHISRNLSDDGKVCFFAYDGGNPRKTILPNRLKELLEINMSINFINVQRDLSNVLLQGSEYIGQKSNKKN